MRKRPACDIRGGDSKREKGEKDTKEAKEKKGHFYTWQKRCQKKKAPTHTEWKGERAREDKHKRSRAWHAMPSKHMTHSHTWDGVSVYALTFNENFREYILKDTIAACQCDSINGNGIGYDWAEQLHQDLSLCVRVCVFPSVCIVHESVYCRDCSDQANVNAYSEWWWFNEWWALDRKQSTKQQFI